MGDAKVGEWTQLGELDGPAGFLKVRGRRYRYPDGNEAVWDILVGGATVAIVALTDDEQVVLARQYRPGPGQVLLELPGGNADGDEPVEVAAARELLEETGYEAAALEVVMRTFLSSYASHRRHAVLARGCRKVAEPRLDDAEFIETVLMPVGAFIEHVLSGQLTDTDVAFAGLAAAGYLKPSP
ncbi:NUDIX hydrolase [Nonomuraea gerenzanensis]|uniref:NUDIX hydrolase n=1 Tax=Nonomuraea gerenzanensis TaxID=93944 RepID=UPI001CD9229E|nr:NUDIX hydrolase [Nonomuraea gerenzanensis]UBU08442.1 NUDIX hydrolase [Nonomuraea gerenzanensis]